MHSFFGFLDSMVSFFSSCKLTPSHLSSDHQTLLLLLNMTVLLLLLFYKFQPNLVKVALLFIFNKNNVTNVVSTLFMLKMM